MRALRWYRLPPKGRVLQLTIFLGSLLSAGRFAVGQVPEAHIRTEVSLVNVIFSVLDRASRPVVGLKQEDFLVFEDRKPQKIEYFSQFAESSDVPTMDVDDSIFEAPEGSASSKKGQSPAISPDELKPDEEIPF